MMRERRRGWGIWYGGVAAMVVAVASPGTAAAATGGGSWEGVLTLSLFPCPGGGTCPGSFSGALAGSVTGLDPAGHPFIAIWPDPSAPPNLANLTASFNYSEACPLGATGEASGTFNLTGGYVNDNGVVAHDAAVSGQFGWLRAGLAVAISTSGGVVTGGGQTLATQQTIGEGAGAFVPLSVPGDCLNIQSLTAQVTGAFAQPE